MVTYKVLHKRMDVAESQENMLLARSGHVGHEDNYKYNEQRLFLFLSLSKTSSIRNIHKTLESTGGAGYHE